MIALQAGKTGRLFAPEQAAAIGLLLFVFVFVLLVSDAIKFDGKKSDQSKRE